jgi:hypothetical protein
MATNPHCRKPLPSVPAAMPPAASRMVIQATLEITRVIIGVTSAAAPYPRAEATMTSR